jgi:hypothetical protein
MDIVTTRGVATSFYSYIGRNPKELELHRETANWEDLQQNFVITFSFEHENPKIYTTLKLVKDKIFEELEVEIVTTY